MKYMLLMVLFSGCSALWPIAEEVVEEIVIEEAKNLENTRNRK